jgi:hypothetical protein
MLTYGKFATVPMGEAGTHIYLNVAALNDVKITDDAVYEIFKNEFRGYFFRTYQYIPANDYKGVLIVKMESI